jgi:DNA polymerase III epsilon subunit-like protein
MFRTVLLRLHARGANRTVGTAAKASIMRRNRELSPVEVFTQVQLGAIPSLAATRNFIVAHFAHEMADRGLSEAKLMIMDAKKTSALLKTLFFERYMSLPFTLVSFDLEFTGIPTFTDEGPTEDIVELAMYCPDTKEEFASLVRPIKNRRMTQGAADLTGITDDMLTDAPPFADVWRQACDFIARSAQTEGAKERVLLLSHGGRLSDVSMLSWACGRVDSPVPGNFRFGDTHHHIRELHRRRPVTKDRQPHSWQLDELAAWLKVGETRTAKTKHRALPDARLTWDVVYHTMDRYGDEAQPPRQQLVMRFFDPEGKAVLDRTPEGYANLGGKMHDPKAAPIWAKTPQRDTDALF